MSDAILDEVIRTDDDRNGDYTPSEQADIAKDRERVKLAREVLADAGDVLGQVLVDWRDGRRVIRVLMTDRLDHYRRPLSDRLGEDRVLVELTALSEDDVASLREQLPLDREALAAQGVFLVQWGMGLEGFSMGYLAWDPPAAELLLRERYGDGVTLTYRGASNHTFNPFPFASWHAEGDRLHVFYALGPNGEQPAGCQAFEDDRSVVVALSIKDWRGAKTLVGGFTPSHATVQLERPLGDRVVIDDSANLVRPHWSQV